MAFSVINIERKIDRTKFNSEYYLSTTDRLCSMALFLNSLLFSFQKDDNPVSHLQTNSTNLKSMHLSPIAGNVRPASISPRVSNTNDTLSISYSNSSSKRPGELNPLRTGRLLNGRLSRILQINKYINKQINK